MTGLLPKTDQCIILITKNKTMKNILATFVFAFIALSGYAQQKFILKGHLDGIKSDSLVMLVTKADFLNNDRMDTVLMHNGDFQYTFTDKYMRPLTIVGLDGGFKGLKPGNFVSIIAVPGETAIIKGTFAKHVLTGSSYYTQSEACSKLIIPVDAEINKLNGEYYAKMKSGANNDSLSNAMKPAFDELDSKKIKIRTDFIRKYPTSQFSGYMLAFIPARIRPEYKKIVASNVLNGPTSYYLKRMEEKEAMLRNREERAKGLVAGVMAPDFTLTDVNEKPFKLSSLRGKTVILDFWGSWCYWCVKGFPTLKKYYDKYKLRGLEILGVDCYDGEKMWKDALKKYDIPWLHVRNGKAPDAMSLFGITSFPTKILIDKDGKIVKFSVGEDPKFYTALDDLFK